MTIEEQAIVYFKDMRKRMCEDYLKICPKDSVAYHATLIEKGFYDTAIKALEQEPNWIPCSERLPGDREIVLLSAETDKVFEGRFFDDNTDCQWYVFRNEAFLPNHVVAGWMPLPKVYKGESEDKE